MTQTVRVLLIEDNRIEALQTQRWLATANGEPFEVEWVESLAEGLERLTQIGIDIVLLDINLPDSRGLETFMNIHAQVPEIPVVVLTGQDDEKLGAMAVDNGAQDYLVKQQIDGNKLARVLRFTLARCRANEDQINKTPSRKSARVIGLLGAKGGVGTTTVALHVATALAKKYKSVILAELRPTFGTLAYHLHQDPKERNLRTLLDHIPETISEEDVAARLCKGPAGLRVLFGPQQSDEFKEIEPSQSEALVKTLAKMAAFVLLDLPSQPSAATQAAIGLCHSVTLVTERESSSVLCGKVALKQLQSWGVGGDAVSAVVVNRNENPRPIALPEIRSRLGCELVGVVPLAISACFDTDLIVAGFVEMGDRIAAQKLVGLKF